MPENTEGTAKRTLSSKALAMKNKLIFFALNLVCVLPHVAKRYSHWGAGIAAGMLLVLFFLTVLRPGANTPASRNLPFFGLIDAGILLGLFFQDLKLRFTMDNMSSILALAESRPRCIWLVPVGVVLCVLPFKGILAVWMKGLGRTAIGASLLLLLGSDGRLPKPTFFVNGGEAFFFFYLLCAVAWYTLCAVSYAVDEDVQRRDYRLSWLLLGVFCTLCLTETSLVWEMLGPVQMWLLAVPSVGLAWWKAVFAMVVLIGCAVAAYDFDYACMGEDSLVLGTLGGGILLLRVLLSSYFVFSWLVIPVFLVGAFHCLQNEVEQEKTLRLSSPAYLIAQTAALLLAVCLLKRGLWVVATLLVVYGLVFYTVHGKMGTPRRQLCRWLETLSCPVALALGYIWQARFILSSCFLLAAVYGVLAFVIILLLWPHPSGQSCPDGYKLLVCGAMALLCLMTATRYGAKARIAFQPEDGMARIELEARGKDNEIVEAAYHWSGLDGEPRSGEIPLSAGETEIPIGGEKLTVVVTDAHGARTTFTDWYPGWMLEE